VLRVATFNVNGIRAAARRGFGPWLAAGGCDVVALQEVRCPAPALPEGVFGDLVLSYDSGDRAGRNGVAVLTREPPAAVRTWHAARPLARSLREFVDEGRYLEVDLADRPLTVASLYLPIRRLTSAAPARPICPRAACRPTCRPPGAAGRRPTVAPAMHARCASSTAWPVS
jgi:exonuclease III